MMGQAPAESAAVYRKEAIFDLDGEDEAAMMDLDAEEAILGVLYFDAMDRRGKSTRNG